MQLSHFMHSRPMTHAPRHLLVAASLVLAAAAPAVAQEQPTLQMPPLQQPVYKCGPHAYTHVPCAGGHQLGEKRVSRTFDRNTPPPQDRARQMARAQLPPETREQCSALESRIRDGESRLRARTEPPSEAEEGELAIQRVHYRELRC